MVKTLDDIAQHPIMQQLIHALQHEGFESSIECKHNDPYITLTIQRKHHYY